MTKSLTEEGRGTISSHTRRRCYQLDSHIPARPITGNNIYRCTNRAWSKTTSSTGHKGNRQIPTNSWLVKFQQPLNQPPAAAPVSPHLPLPLVPGATDTVGAFVYQRKPTSSPVIKTISQPASLRSPTVPMATGISSQTSC